jgi:hypothetical protein
MTLVIVADGSPVPTLWTSLQVDSMSEAIQALYDREGAERTGSIGRWPVEARPHRFSREIGIWAREKKLEAVVWTDLKPGFRYSRGTVPTLEQVVRHLGSLEGKPRERAAEYILRAPPQIATPFRPALQKLLS